MPEYLAPGVFVEEVSFRAKAIEGVGTSVAGLVGPTRTGPLRGTPELLTSFEEYVRVFGDALPLVIDGVPVHNQTALAARAFFDNGGRRLYVARVVKDANASEVDGTGSTAVRGSVRDKDGVVIFVSRFPGAVTNYALEIHWRDRENLLQVLPAQSPLETDGLYIVEAPALPQAALVDTNLTADKFPVAERGLATGKADGTVTVDSAKFPFTVGGAPGAVSTNPVVGLHPDKFGSKNRLLQAVLRSPSQGPLPDTGTVPITLSFSDPVGEDEAPFLGDGWGAAIAFVGSYDVVAGTVTLTKLQNPGLAADRTVSLAALGGVRELQPALMVRRRFDLGVRVLNADGTVGEEIYSYPDLSLDPADPTGLASLLQTPSRRFDQLTSPVACTLKAGATVDGVDKALFNLYSKSDLFKNPDAITGVRYVIQLAGGIDGRSPGAADYAGEVDVQKGSVGLAALENVDDVSIVMTPAAADIPGDGDGGEHLGVVLEVQKHCRRMRYRVGIVDSRQGMSIGEVRAFRDQLSDDRLALYYPWVVIDDPNGVEGDITVPPGGFVAGVYANTDITRGVHKAPANEVVLGAKRFEVELNQFQQEALNPERINCLRRIPGLGLRVWGGRTLSEDSEWMYVNVRRYFLYLEKSIDKSTQWVVFEPNGEQLWDNVRNTVDQFLFNEWRSGRLLGATPKEAYFVRCDRTTMTQNDLDMGRLVCLIGAAPLRPAEFVIFRIGQKTADAT